MFLEMPLLAIKRWVFQVLDLKPLFGVWESAPHKIQ